MAIEDDCRYEIESGWAWASAALAGMAIEDDCRYEIESGWAWASAALAGMAIEDDCRYGAGYPGAGKTKAACLPRGTGGRWVICIFTWHLIQSLCLR
jgi:hypothetical protein